MSEYNIKAIKEQFKKNGVFYTTNELSLLLKSFVYIDYSEVYDPTCGDGALLSVFDDSVIKFGQEINAEQLEVAKNRLVNFNGVCGDTLKNPAFGAKKFECIVANPPFSIAWNPNAVQGDDRFSQCPFTPPKSKADYAFMLHILHHLSSTGVAVVLNFPGVLYRGNAEGKIRQWMVENNYIDKVIKVPPKKFVDTAIETAIIVLKKNKITSDIEFMDIEKDTKRIVSADEVKNNGYVLSVNSYVFDEIEKPTINPSDLQRKSRDRMIRQLKADIEVDKMVSEIEGYSFGEYLDSLHSVIESFRNEAFRIDPL